MRRLGLLAGSLVVTAVPAVLVATPAYAADNVICVGSPAGPCDTTAASLAAAITAADGNSLDDTIYLGPGDWTGGVTFDGLTEALTIKGSGQGSTFITLPAGGQQTYLQAQDARIERLTVTMNSTTSSGDTGISLFGGATVSNVSVDAPGVANATGISAIDSTVNQSAVSMDTDALSSSRAFNSNGGNAVSEVVLKGNQGYTLSDPGSVDEVSEATITAYYQGVVTDGGTINISNALVDMQAGGGTGLGAINFNNGTAAKEINASHVTVVGGGPGSVGVWAYAAAQGAKTTSTVNLTSSIVRGPAKSLLVSADNDGAQGGPSTALINIGYSAYETIDSVIDPANGAGGVNVNPGTTTADPQFAGPADYHPVAASPVIDKGDPTTTGPAYDLDGNFRRQDGNGDGIAVRDMGAFELGDGINPVTTFTGGPTVTRDTTPTFTFISDPESTFTCQIDGGATSPCSSPFTTPVLGGGTHTLAVEATDLSINTETTPAVRTFTVDLTKPTTKLVRKPGKIVSAPKAKFTFTSNESAATFQCALDSKKESKFKTCLSPAKLKVKLGKHTFYVRAVDAAGNVDATPAKYRFTKVKKPKASGCTGEC